MEAYQSREPWNKGKLVGQHGKFTQSQNPNRPKELSAVAEQEPD